MMKVGQGAVLATKRAADATIRAAHGLAVASASISRRMHTRGHRSSP